MLGVGVFGGAARGDVEGRLQRRSVVELAGDLRNPAGSGGQVRYVRAPPVRPVGELPGGAGDGGPPEPEPARTVPS